MKRIITLLTDFGLKDTYVAEMKAAIYSINPEAIIVDMTHEIERHNIRQAAFILRESSRYFPEGTIHVTVVDRGVGSKCQKPLIVETGKYIFIGPDNGVLYPAAIENKLKKVYAITPDEIVKYTGRKISRTFHGRDIYAPTAALISKGIPIDEIAQEVADFIKLELKDATRENDIIIGEVLYIDHFGNLITNVREEMIPENCRKLTIEVHGRSIEIPIVESYSEVQPGEKLAIIGSKGFLEISINLGNAAEFFDLREGEKFKIKLHEI